MRIDVFSIFPEYLTPLQLSLIGKAQVDGLLQVNVHDLRDWTHDRHRTVDDTPYGGGAGMVMKPEPWGEALDSVLNTRPEPQEGEGQDQVGDTSATVISPRMPWGLPKRATTWLMVLFHVREQLKGTKRPDSSFER